MILEGTWAPPGVDDDHDDDERKNSKKAKFVSNDRSGHDDQFCPKIVKIGAILAIFRPFEDFGNMAKIEPTWLVQGGEGGGVPNPR